MEATLRQHVLAAAQRPEVREAVGRVYTDLQREIDARKPICATSGRCCRFDEFGHRLFVTTMELATFQHSLPLPACGERAGERGKVLTVINPRSISAKPTGCPYQLDGLCTVHAIRPFGCRVFFCDATATAWQQEQYQKFHFRLKRLHDQLNVPYLYVEWRQALKALSLASLPL